MTEEQFPRKANNILTCALFGVPIYEHRVIDYPLCGSRILALYSMMIRGGEMRQTSTLSLMNGLQIGVQDAIQPT